VYLKVHISESVYTSEQDRDYASCLNSGIHLFTPFYPFHPEITILGLYKEVYVLGGSAGYCQGDQNQ